jgi:hypothetical protein
MIQRLIALLFLSREIAHREHLRTRSFSQHMALGEFYEEVVEKADEITEVYQGRRGVIDEIPYLPYPSYTDVIDAIERQLAAIEKIRYTAVPKEETAIQNLIDEAVGLHLRTLYKLRTLK